MRRTKIMTNGCFDLFHAGHKRIIKKCLEFSNSGTVYILVNSDKWIRENKGPDRPIWLQEKRMNAIQAYVSEWCASHMEYPQIKIILFDSDEELKQKIVSLRPDILLKGQDYTDVSKIIGYGLTSILVLPKSDIEEETKTTTELINANSST